ncbi:MAG: hypothetical protein PUE04_04435 [Lachnospira sp.]|nr:hypothetical protein [Lachnospira sp.]
MRKFARRVLIILLCAILGGGIGAVFTLVREPALYTSEAQLYVVPGDSESMLRASDGGLKQDFAIVFKSPVVMDTVKSSIGTTEDITDNLEVETPANSNIIVLKYSAATAETAKNTVDVIASTAVRTTTIVPVSSISILQQGTMPEKAHHLHLKTNSTRGAWIGAAVSFAACILAALFSNAFRPKREEEEQDMLYKNVLPRLRKLEQSSSQQVLLPGATKEAVAAAAAQLAPDDELVQYMKKHRRIHRSEEADALAGDDLEDDLMDMEAGDDEDDEIARAARAAEAAENEALVHHAIVRHVARAVAAANAAASQYPEQPDILATPAPDKPVKTEKAAQPAVKKDTADGSARNAAAPQTQKEQSAGGAEPTQQSQNKVSQAEAGPAVEKKPEEKAPEEKKPEEKKTVTEPSGEKSDEEKQTEEKAAGSAEEKAQPAEKKKPAASDRKRRSGTEILGRIRK